MNITGTRGRDPSGVRPVMSVPRVHRKTIKLVAGMRPDWIVALAVVDGDINGEAHDRFPGGGDLRSGDR